MNYDLNSDDPDLTTTYDVCVVGIGIAGSYLLYLLSMSGLKICGVDAGNIVEDRSLKRKMMPIQKKAKYAALTKGRSFRLGGNSHNWGGLLIPYTKLDLPSKKSPYYNTWAEIIRVCNKYGKQVYDNLLLGAAKKISKNPDSRRDSFFKKNVYDIIDAISIPFSKRNIFLNLKNSFKKIDIFCNAICYDLETSKTKKRIDSVSIISTKTKKLYKIKSKKIILCTGAIETTKILLLIYKKNKFKRQNLGKLLSDHISFPLAEINQKKIRFSKFSYLLPKYKNGILYTKRLILKKSKNFNYFLHIIIKNKNNSYSLLKSFFQSIQSGKFNFKNMLEMSYHFKDILYFLYYRIFKGRIYIPKNSKLILQVDLEQCLTKGNKINLTSQKNEYNINQAEIYWSIGKKDKFNLKSVIKDIKSSVLSNSFIYFKNIDEVDNFRKSYDAYHPTGTTIIGKTKQFEINLDLRNKHFKNLYVLSTSNFPGPGKSNPTFSLLCFAHQLCDNLLKYK